MPSAFFDLHTIDRVRATTKAPRILYSAGLVIQGREAGFEFLPALLPKILDGIKARFL